MFCKRCPCTLWRSWSTFYFFHFYETVAKQQSVLLNGNCPFTFLWCSQHWSLHQYSWHKLTHIQIQWSLLVWWITVNVRLLVLLLDFWFLVICCPSQYMPVTVFFFPFIYRQEKKYVFFFFCFTEIVFVLVYHVKCLFQWNTERDFFTLQNYATFSNKVNIFWLFVACKQLFKLTFIK